MSAVAATATAWLSTSTLPDLLLWVHGLSMQLPVERTQQQSNTTHLAALPAVCRTAACRCSLNLVMPHASFNHCALAAAVVSWVGTIGGGGAQLACSAHIFVCFRQILVFPPFAAR